MKRIAPILLLGMLACSSTSSDRTSPTNPATDSRLGVDAGPIQAELFSDEFCKGGNVWWSARFNIFGPGIPSLDNSEIHVYTIDPHGAWKFFGVARSGVPELEGFDFQFYADGVAPPDSIPDFRGVGYPANYGRVPFGFKVYVKPNHTLLGDAEAYSDVPITSNLFPHACQGIKPHTGCERLGELYNTSASAFQAGGVWNWQIGGDFIAGACVNSTLGLKAYFVAPNGKKVLFARGEASALAFGAYEFTVSGIAPVIDVTTLPVDWAPRFLLQFTSKGTPVGVLDFTAPTALTPNLGVAQPTVSRIATLPSRQ